VREVAAAGRPFFLFFHLFDPHYPYDPPPEWGRRFLPEGQADFRTTLDRAPGLESDWHLGPEEYAEVVARYDGEIAYADHHVGRLLDELDALGVLDGALVIVVSDHGETLLERSWIFDHGGRVYDEQVRVPLVFRLPWGRSGGVRVPGQVAHVDILPTVLDVLGIAPPGPLPGRSLLPYMSGGGRPEPARLAFSHAEPHPRRVPHLDTPPLSQQGLVTAVRTLDRKLIEYPIEGGGYRLEFFDLAGDPGERHDLWAERPAEAERMKAVLQLKRSEEAPDAAPLDLPEEVRRGLEALGYGREE
jgi:arylsulfatase A-like enzyme